MDSKERGDWSVVDSRIVIETQHLRLRRDEIELPGGKRISDYYVRESRGFAVIFPLAHDGTVALVRQYKHGIGATVLELPAGAIDPGESSRDCAARELREETGYVCAPDALEHAGTFIFDPTSSTTRYELFVARDLRARTEQALDETESIEVVHVDLPTLRRYVRDGTICVGAHVASIYYVLDRLGRL